MICKIINDHINFNSETFGNDHHYDYFRGRLGGTGRTPVYTSNSSCQSRGLSKLKISVWG